MFLLSFDKTLDVTDLMFSSSALYLYFYYFISAEDSMILWEKPNQYQWPEQQHVTNVQTHAETHTTERRNTMFDYLEDEIKDQGGKKVETNVLHSAGDALIMEDEISH